MNRKRLTVIATENELCLLENKADVLITGVGALNVISALKDVPRETPLYNIGYAGSNTLEIGHEVLIGKVFHYHPNVTFSEPCFELQGDVTCYTNNDFVLETAIDEPCVFDMELAYILAMGFKDVIARKVVSDNLSLERYNDTIHKDTEVRG